jgi:hypothetical protein
MVGAWEGNEGEEDSQGKIYDSIGGLPAAWAKVQ